MTRINRRQAMKAGLGGAAAAAALSVPNIEHFSLAPKTASASSQCPPGTTVNGTPASISKTSVTGGFLGTTHCWGQYTGGACAQSAIGTITVAAASGQYTGPSIAFNVGGQVNNATANSINWTTSNFTANKPYSACNVNITGTCNSGTFTIGGGRSANNAVSANGATTGGTISCAGGVLSTGTVTVKVSCTCGPN